MPPSTDRTVTSLPISQLRQDGGTQPRVALDWHVIDDYQDEMESGAKFPPVTVFYDGDAYWLADGFHRVKAACQAGRTEIACDVHQGTQQDAQWHSYSVNQAHGLRRTRDDVKRAIEAALRHPRAEGISDSAIAEHIGCGHSWVSEIRVRIFPERKDTRTVTRKGKTYEMKVGKIGKRAATATAPPVTSAKGDITGPPASAEPALTAPGPSGGAGDTPPALPGKRQLDRATAEKRRIMDADGLPRICGGCLGLSQMDVSAVAAVCTLAEARMLADRAWTASDQLRAFARTLSAAMAGRADMAEASNS